MRRSLPEAMLQFMVGHQSVAMTDRYDGAGPEEKLKGFIKEKSKIEEVWNE